MSKAQSLAEIVTSTWLQSRAGKRICDRGSAYYHANTVTQMAETATTLSGDVEGSQLYHARVWLENGDPVYHCTCNTGESGGCCKHVVALGLTWLVQREDVKGLGGEYVGYRDLLGLNNYLRSLSKDALIDLVLHQTQVDESFEQRLQSLALRNGYLNASALEEAITVALRLEPNRTAGKRYLQRLTGIVDLLEGLLETGEGKLSQELCELMLTRTLGLEQTAQPLLLALRELNQRLADLHVKACHKTQPEPRQLAQRVRQLRSKDSYQVIHETAYGSLLAIPGTGLSQSGGAEQR